MAEPRNQNNKAREPVEQSKASEGEQENEEQVLSWQSDFEGLSLQLHAEGFKIVEVGEDGNCLFRALADQLEGNEDEHEKYRAMAVSFIKFNQDYFEPFLDQDDEGSFDEYCRSMGTNGTWAGNMELQAVSFVTQSNICVHLYNSEPTMINCENEEDAPTIHLAYHDGEHYNSVRLKEDIIVEPAATFIKGNGELSTRSDKNIVDRKLEQASYIFSDVKDENGHENATKAEQTSQCGVDGAVQVPISEQQGSVDKIVAETEPFDSMKYANGGLEPPQNQEQEEFVPSLINVHGRKRKRTPEESSAFDQKKTERKN